MLFADSNLRTDTKNSSIEFYVKPLLDCDSKKEVFGCIQEIVDLEKSLANDNPDETSQPLWEITDLFGGRIDTKYSYL